MNKNRKLKKMSDENLEIRANVLEQLIRENSRDWKSLPVLNGLFQSVIEEQARRDALKQEKKGNDNVNS